MSKLITELIETKNGSYHKTTCVDGHYITNFNEEIDDILTFSATKTLCTPLSVNVQEEYHCIDDADFSRLENAKIAAEEIERAKHEREMKEQL